MNKKNKKINMFLIILGIVLIISISIFIYFTFKEDDNEIKYNDPKRIAERYVKAILSNDFSTAYKYINIPQDMITSKSDFEEFIKSKKYYNDLKGRKYKSIKEISTESYEVSLVNENGDILIIDVELVERTINDFRVDESDYLVYDYKISIPKASDLYFNNTLIDKSYIKEMSTHEDTYVFPLIAKSKKKARVETVFGTKELDISIENKENDEYDKVTVDFNNEEMKKKAYDFVKTTWNDMFTQYTKKSKISKVKKYFDSKFKDADIKKVYTTAFDKITKGKTAIGKYEKYNISKIIDNPNQKNIVIDNEFVTLNFGYTLKWRWKYLNANSAVNMSMNRYSSIKLRYDGQKFMIYDIIDNGLFNYANQYTRDF